MGKRPIRVILDTNWYVSASINRRSRRTLYDLLTNQRLCLLGTQKLVDEYSTVIFRKKFQQFIRANQVRRFLNLVMPRLEQVELHSTFFASQDPNDNYLLALAHDGKADYLVTGDPDLLVLVRFGETHIVKMAEFQALLTGDGH